MNFVIKLIWKELIEVKIEEISVDIVEENGIVEEIEIKSLIFINSIIDLLAIDFSFFIIYSLL